MVHTIFDASLLQYDDFFNGQNGEGVESPFFAGVRFQRGYGQRGRGLGNVLASIWRMLSPTLARAGKTLGRESLEAGSRILTDIASGKDIKSVVRTHAETGAKNLLKRASNQFLQEGSGRKRKIAGRIYSRKPRKDALGHY